MDPNEMPHFPVQHKTMFYTYYCPNDMREGDISRGPYIIYCAMASDCSSACILKCAFRPDRSIIRAAVEQNDEMRQMPRAKWSHWTLGH